ncbi:hypothetical protein K474DRAFT_1675159 [Panus rudis PR-1116 ss-1]|nr:hypothetical protein K474DRAFT_1675159 [Panus rudis PR-1116 ss-1]
MSKSISNGTLSLRFMQNAQRARQQAEVAAQQAKIKDEAEWEVSQETKEAWGIGSSSGPEDLTHESSYLPFLFSSAGDPDAPSSEATRMKGRRTFNARGQEVQQEPVIESKDDKEAQTATDQGTSKTSGKAARPVTISGFQSPLTSMKLKDAKRNKTAQMLIREDHVRGQRTPLKMFEEEESKPPSSIGFLKPAGVDAPPPASRKEQGSSSVNPAGKRSREASGDTPAGTGEKKKRKKRKESS